MERCRGCAGGQRGAMALTARGKVVPRALFAAIALVVRSLGSARSHQDHRGSPHVGAGAAARPLPLRLVLHGSDIAKSGGHAALRGGGPDLTSISSAKSGWRSPLGAFPGGKSPRDTSYSGWGTEGGGAAARKVLLQGQAPLVLEGWRAEKRLQLLDSRCTTPCAPSFMHPFCQALRCSLRRPRDRAPRGPARRGV